MMKPLKVVTVILCLCLSMTLFSGCKAPAAIYEPGTYYGLSEGYYSYVHVRVDVTASHIVSIEIINHAEPEVLSKIVFRDLPPRMIKMNAAQVDTIARGNLYQQKSYTGCGVGLRPGKKEGAR